MFDVDGWRTLDHTNTCGAPLFPMKIVHVRIKLRVAVSASRVKNVATVTDE